jgi:putative transposase
MEIPRRKSLPHEIPLWIDPNREVYFITIKCEKRGLNQLAEANIARALYETVEFRQRNCTWWCYVFLLMPDHVHALMSFPNTGKRVQLRISKWKEWTAKKFALHWQRDYFEHRLRREESLEEKSDYILANPVRKGLVNAAHEWPYIWFADGPRPYGWPER